ncbi:unnamed protein product [Prorocentrum cordatum]|uniref:Uncharacterized protein n=1 Tax=Prorocentrum cordatum TaxID=2364126 RepID=A0ABN9QS49_9DINO|nr:unnamed protein product [Polarella glacialis]
MPTASNSPITCAASEKLYCLASDTCKKDGDCSQCPGKTTVDAEKHTCSGMPSEKASVSFKDTDMQEGSVGGEVKITKAKNEFDIDKYVLYWGKDSTTKLDPPLNALVGEVSPTGGDAFFSIPAGTPFPSAASHLLVFSKNEYGEYLTPGNVALKDAVAPKAKPGGIVFEDDDGDKGELGGTVTINRASDEDGRQAGRVRPALGQVGHQKDLVRLPHQRHLQGDQYAQRAVLLFQGAQRSPKGPHTCWCTRRTSSASSPLRRP